MSETLFRDHLQSVFPQTCLNLTRKLWSLEQFAKYTAARAKITSEYAHGLERLATKTKSSSNLFFEESEVSKVWTQIQQSEVEFAKQQAALATALQERVADRLTLVKGTTENLLKGVESEGQAASKLLNDTLQAMQKCNDTYYRCCRELEAEEYKRKEEKNKSAEQIQKRDRKIAKAKQDVEQAETAYRAAVENAANIQSKHFNEKLPSVLSSLQMLFSQRLTSIDEALSELSSNLLEAAQSSVPVYKQMDDVVKQFSIQRELEEYVSKTEQYFTQPPTPTFQQFVKTPEGQVPSLITEKQSSWAGKFHQKLSALASSTSATLVNVGIGKGTSGLLLGKSLDVIMSQQASKYPKLKVPYGYVFLADAILKLNGPSTLGVFRVSGQLSSVEVKKQELDQGKYVLPNTVHDASSLFKFFLRSLPDSLVPISCYDAAINEQPSSHDVFNNLPEPNKTVAGFVIRYIRDHFLIPDVIGVTQMNLENIITCFVPCFLRSQSTDIADFFKHAEQERAWMRKCFTSLDVSKFPTLEECLSLASQSGSAGGSGSSGSDGSSTGGQRRVPPPVSTKPHPQPPAPRKALPMTPPGK